MGSPAARLTDMHVCPMVTPGVPPIPHVGGPITGPGAPNVLIGSMPAAVLGDICTCVGPPDTIILGSMGVMIGGKPAARLGDTTAHGGSIILGLPTVMIGEMSPGSGSGGGGGGAGASASGGAASSEDGGAPAMVAALAAAPPAVAANIISQLPDAVAPAVSMAVQLAKAALESTPLHEKCVQCPPVLN